MSNWKTYVTPIIEILSLDVLPIPSHSPCVTLTCNLESGMESEPVPCDDNACTVDVLHSWRMFKYSFMM